MIGIESLSSSSVIRLYYPRANTFYLSSKNIFSAYTLFFLFSILLRLFPGGHIHTVPWFSNKPRGLLIKSTKEHSMSTQ